MHTILPKNLKTLAELCPKPLYVVGGSVRDFLSDFKTKTYDWDIGSPLSAEELVDVANRLGVFSIRAVYKNTGTVKLQDCDGVDYEYSCFRSDKYVRGVHQPVEIFFTEDIVLDAKRRDFTANAVYYDILNERFVDPLDGISAIKAKRFTTVATSEKVFGEDGLRLLRLARQSAQLGFYPDEECFLGARKNAALIKDISPERIYTELNLLLCADEKYGNTDGPYQGLHLLKNTNVLGYIFPELTLGKDMAQRADFHKYDILEHSLRAVKYAPKPLRLAALLHDVGKPFCQLQYGNVHTHPQEGARIAKEILTRLKAPKKTVERIPALVELHMYDFNCQTKENKLRRFFVKNYDLLNDLLAIKQADFSACMDDTSIAPTVIKWSNILQKMQEEHTPFHLKELDCTGKDLLDLNVPPPLVSKTLHALLVYTATHPKENKKQRLLFLVPRLIKQLSIEK